jgi:hypothetical protein
MNEEELRRALEEIRREREKGEVNGRVYRISTQQGQTEKKRYMQTVWQYIRFYLFKV